MNDSEFREQLRDFLRKDPQVDPWVPVLLNPDGSINRDKTLGLPLYEGFELEERP